MRAERRARAPARAPPSHVLTPPACVCCCVAQVPALGIFEKSLEMGKFDKSRTLSDGSMMTFKKARKSARARTHSGTAALHSGGTRMRRE